MQVLLIALWTIAIILLVADYKTESTRWLACICFFSGLGGFSVLMRQLKHNLEAINSQDINLINNLEFIHGLSTSLAHYIAPYTLLIYAIVYSKVFKDKWNVFRMRVVWILLIPPFIMYIFFPVYPFATSFLILSIWVAPYVLTANFLLVKAFLVEKERKIKQQRLLTCVIITPGTLMSLMTNYLLRVFDVNNAFYYNIWIIVLQFAAFLFFAIKQGALGVKVTIEKNSMDRTMRALTSGTAMLNHTIKNEVLKISMCMRNIEHTMIHSNCAISNAEDMHENIGIVNSATDYLTVMINKIQDQVKDIVLNEQVYNIGIIIDKAIDMVAPFLKIKDIGVSKEYSYDLFIFCDGIHLQEVLINLLKNSIEAIEHNGRISIGVARKNRDVSVVVSDNGQGIPKGNLASVMEPFFSTKHRTGNFGLGLSYCYGVMQQHGGKLEVGSEEGMGTTVSLGFPAKRLRVG